VFQALAPLPGSVSSCATSLKLAEKEGIMAFSNPINIATASVEQTFERLCWLYSTFRSTFVFDAIGKSYPLLDITQLTRGKIPYSERFNEMIDYQQNAAMMSSHPRSPNE
jgi:hypothetical protein